MNATKIDRGMTFFFVISEQYVVKIKNRKFGNYMNR